MRLRLSYHRVTKQLVSERVGIKGFKAWLGKSCRINYIGAPYLSIPTPSRMLQRLPLMDALRTLLVAAAGS